MNSKENLPKVVEEQKSELPVLPDDISAAIATKIEEGMKNVNVGSLFSKAFKNIAQKGLGSFFENPNEFIAQTVKEVATEEITEQLQKQQLESGNSEQIKLDK